MIFDEDNQFFDPNPEYNLLFLKAQQSHANDLLQARGHVLLNDVHDMLGLPRTQEGTRLGWLAGGESVNFGLPHGHIEGPIELTFNAKEDVYAALG